MPRTEQYDPTQATTEYFKHLRSMAIDRIAAERPQTVDSIEGVLNKIVALAEHFETQKQEIKDDSRLTPEGKVDAKEKLARESLAKIGKFEEEHVRGMQARVAQVESRMAGAITPKPPTDPAERLAYEMRKAEIVRQLAGLDPMEIEVIYGGASDPMIIDAIESAPPQVYRPEKQPGEVRQLPELRPLIDPEKRSAIHMARGKAHDPETAAELEWASYLEQMYRSQASGLKEAILEDVPGARADDNIADLVEASKLGGGDGNPYLGGDGGRE